MIAAALAMLRPSASTSSSTSHGGQLVSVDGRTLPLRDSHLAVEAGSGIARTVLTQRFVNPHAEPLRVTYKLPLPADGAVAGFAFTVREKRVLGEVDERRRARERFETALAEGRSAAIIDQERTSLFTQEVGNIPPGETVLCEVTVDQPLVWIDEGSWEWRFPTVVGPRYMGATGRVSDAAEISTDHTEGDTKARMRLELSISDGLTGGVESPSHSLKVDGSDVRLDMGARLDRDFVVRWPVALDEASVSVDAARPGDPRHDGASYGLLTVVPPRPSSDFECQARDLIVLIDTSGSMGGRPLQQAKRVIGAMLDTLGPKDRIELIEFGSSPRRFQAEPLACTRDGVKAAHKWLRALRASGGTEMKTAVLEALTPLREEAQRQVVLVTDGYIGFEQEIISTVLERLPAGSRLHTLGVGSSVNRSLTKGAARAGRGAEVVIGIDEDAERATARLVARTAKPIVTELSIEGARATAGQLPDLYAGAPALMPVMLEPGEELVIRGQSAAGPFEHRVKAPALALGEGRQGVSALFGRELVEDLETKISAGHAHRSIDQQITQVGLRFQIATRLTSWVAVSDDVTVEAGSETRQETMPQEIPHGVSIGGLGLRSAAGGFGMQGAAVPAPSARPRMAKRKMAMPAKEEERVTALYSMDSEGADDFAAEMAPPGGLPVSQHAPQGPAQITQTGSSSFEPLGGGAPEPQAKGRSASAPVPELRQAPLKRKKRRLFVALLLLIALVYGLVRWLTSSNAEQEQPEPTNHPTQAEESSSLE